MIQTAIRTIPALALAALEPAENDFMGKERGPLLRGRQIVGVATHQPKSPVGELDQPGVAKAIDDPVVVDETVADRLKFHMLAGLMGAALKYRLESQQPKPKRFGRVFLVSGILAARKSVADCYALEASNVPPSE